MEVAKLPTMAEIRVEISADEKVTEKPNRIARMRLAMLEVYLINDGCKEPSNDYPRHGAKIREIRAALTQKPAPRPTVSRRLPTRSIVARDPR